MEPTVVEALGPPPFRFQPSQEPAVEGAAFSFPFKLLVTCVVAATLGWGLRLWMQGRLGVGAGAALWWFLGALGMIVWTWWAIVRSRTRIDARELHQTWIWTRRMDLRELASVRMVRVRGLEWLIAPRIYARTLLGKFAVFYVADQRLLAECERLSAELQAFRTMR